MTTDDVVTRLLDSRRFLGLLTNESGRILARYSTPNADGDGTLIHLADISGTAPRRLTRGSQSIGPAALSDGGVLYFAAKRAGDDGKDAEHPGLWALPDSGEARKLADHAGGFSRLEVAGNRLIAELPVHSQAGTEREHAEFDKERGEAKVSAILHSGFPVRKWDGDRGPARQRLAVAELSEVQVGLDDLGVPSSGDDDAPLSALNFRYLNLPQGTLTDWAVDEAGTFAIVHLERPIPGQLEAGELWKVDLDGSAEPQRLTEAAVDHDYSMEAISPDGTKLIVAHELFWTPETNLSVHLEVIDLATVERAPVWPDADSWFDVIWADDTTLVATADDHGRGAVFIGAPDDAQPRRLAGGPEQKFAFGELVRQGTTVVGTASAIDVVPHPVSIDLDTGEVTVLVGPGTDIESVGNLSEVTARAEDGTEVRAWLCLPDGDGPHPLVVFAHGGPWGSWNAWTYRWNPGPFVAAGYAVLLPDPAISTGYGQSMIDRGQQELGGAPFTDIMALTDVTVARTDIDAARTAFAGGSYGGYMANWVAGHTGDRFRCIVSHASLWNTVSMGRTTDNSSWDIAMRRQGETYSPHLFAESIEVPMLVIHGDKDYRVPIGQGQELWYDLLSKSMTPLDDEGLTQHRFLYFPDEGHWVAGRGNAEVWYRTFIAFLDRHVRGVETPRLLELG